MDNIAIGNYILNIYFGSFDIKDNEEHLYYKFTFKTSDGIPLAIGMLDESSYNLLLDNMETFLSENCGFGFDFLPSEPMMTYSLWVGYIDDIKNKLNVEIALFKTRFGENEKTIFDTLITVDEYYKLFKEMSG